MNPIIFIGLGLAVLSLTSSGSATGTAGIKIRSLIGKLMVSSTLHYKTRTLSQIKRVVIHHSATLSTAAGSNAQSYAKYHVENRGWPGIGYHAVIDPDGTINETNKLTTVCYHVENHNTGSVGVCLSGNFDVEKPTQAQINSLVWYIKGINSAVGRKLEIDEHNDFQNKSCPGANLPKAEIIRLVG